MIKGLLTSVLIITSITLSTEPMDVMDHDMHHGHGTKHSSKMHGPIGLMGDHFLHKGESMVSIRYMKMLMNQLIFRFQQMELLV